MRACFLTMMAEVVVPGREVEMADDGHDQQRC
jgi:hypothetical protein